MIRLGKITYVVLVWLGFADFFWGYSGRENGWIGFGGGRRGLAREFFWGKHLLKKISTDCLKSLIPFRALLINPIGMDNNVKCSALCVRTLKEDSSRNNRAPHKQRENESNHIVLLRALHIL